MNKAKVQQILQLEAQAQKVQQNAQEQAKQIVLDAKTDVQKKQEESAQAAQQEAEQIREKAVSEANIKVIKSQSKRKETHNEKLAKENFDKAVDFVLAQLTVQDS